jgi:carbon-monoxide dehydrogenase medium subunit
LKSTAVIRGASGPRAVELREFHQGPYETAVADAEILVEVRVPVRPGAGSAYQKVERRAGDWAVAAAGAFLQLRDGVVADSGIGLTAVGAEHFTCPEAEAVLVGEEPTAERFAAAAVVCREACNPQADQRGPVDYKRHLVEVLVGRALTSSFTRCMGGDR